MKRNRKSAVEYGIDLFVWGFVFHYYAYTLLFRCLPGLSQQACRWFWWGGGFFCALLSYLLTPKGRRTGGAAFVGILGPAAVYCFAAYGGLYPRLTGIIWLTAGAAALTVLALALAVSAGELARGKYAGKLGKYLLGLCHKCRMAAGSVLGIGLILFTLYLAFWQAPLVSTAAPQPGSTMENRAQTLCLLDSGRWKELTPQERMNVLQAVADVEGERLGLPHELNLRADDLQGTVIGQYADGTHSISVDLDYLERLQPLELVETVAHEAYHAYQHRLVELYEETELKQLQLLQTAAVYRQEFASYVDGTEDLYRYAGQQVEQDSRAYADAAVCRYLEFLLRETEEAAP